MIFNTKQQPKTPIAALKHNKQLQNLIIAQKKNLYIFIIIISHSLAKNMNERYLL